MKRAVKFIMACSLLVVLGCTSETNKAILKIEGKDKIEYFTFTKVGDILLTDEQGKSFKIDNKGKEELEFEVISKIEKKNDYYIIKKDGKIGVLNNEYKEVVKNIYDNIENLEGTEFLKVQRDNKNYLLKFDNYTLSQEYDEIEKIKGSNIIKLRQGNNVWYLDETGKEIKELKGANILFWRDGIVVTAENKKYGLVDLKNEKRIENLYEEIYFAGNNILVKDSGKYYLNGKYLENIKRVYPTMTDVFIYDVGSEKFGLFNLKELKTSDVTYDEIMLRYNDYIIVGKDGKYGVINKYSEKAPEFKYNYVTPAGIDSFAGGTDEETGLVSLIVGDKEVTEEKYENVYSLVEGYYFGELDGQLFLIDENGKELMSTQRDDIVYYDDEVLIVKDGDTQVVYNLKKL